MKAAVYKGNRRFEIEEIPTPTPGPNEVVLRIKYCAICGTDVHCFMYDVAPPGTVMGHEYCGTIAAVGSAVTRWKVGDRVVGGGGAAPPGREPPTHSAPRANYRELAAAETRVRGYAEYTRLEEWEPLPIPDGVTDEMASLCEPCSVAVHAVRLSQLKLGDPVAVLGAGPIGLFCLQAAKAAGAGAVIVSEPAPARADAARALGADAVVDPLSQDVESEVIALAGGLGPRVVFDCAGLGSTLDQAFNLVPRGGQVVLVAVPWEPMPVLPAEWMSREVDFRTSFGSRHDDWLISLNLLERGKIDVAPLLSEEGFIPLEGIQEAFEALMRPTTEVQMVVRP